MHSVLRVLLAVSLTVAGIGVVRPYANDRSTDVWTPVVAARQEVSLEAQPFVDLPRSGEYVVFLEGPADDPLWEQRGSIWIQLFDSETRLPLSMMGPDVDHAVELDGRRVEALASVRVPKRGSFDLDFGRSNTRELAESGFHFVICPAQLVDAQFSKAALWRLGGLSAAVGMAALALLLLLRRSAVRPNYNTR